MKIEKIDIQTSNKKHATDIAMLVDKLDFLREIQRLRQKWLITKLYKLKGILGGIPLLNTYAPLSYTEMTKEEAEKRLPEFTRDIDNVLKIFNRGKNFRLVVLYSLITGVVPNGIYQSCYFDIVTINEPEDLAKPEKYQFVIVLSPRTELKEIKNVFKEFKQHIKGKIKFHAPRISLNSPVTKEFTEAIDCMKREKEIYEKDRQSHKSFKEADVALRKFLINTKKARDYLLTFGDLDINIPDHRELIEQFHKGDIYPAADSTTFKTRKELKNAREWYWIRNIDYFNGELKEPLKPGKVCKIWRNRCKKNKDRKLKDMLFCKCKYCIDPVRIIKSLESYEDLLALC